MEYKISNDQFIIEYEGFRIIMDLKEKFFAQYLNSLTPEQWVDLLTADHSFWEYCDCQDEFYGRDWRKLLQYDFEFFAEYCQWQKLDVEDWFQLLMDKNIYNPPFTAPELLKFCPAVDFDGYQWYKLIRARPELEPVCRWYKLNRLQWHVILLNYPQFAVHCNYGALSETDWAELIAEKPELAKYKPEKCDWKKFNGVFWSRLLCKLPQFADKCDWNKLDRLQWHVILLNYPQFAVHCNYGALSETDWAKLIAKKPELAKYKPENA